MLSFHNDSSAPRVERRKQNNFNHVFITLLMFALIILNIGVFAGGMNLKARMDKVERQCVQHPEETK